MLWFRDLESIMKAEENLEYFQEKDNDIFDEKYIPASYLPLENLDETQLDELSDILEAKETEIRYSEWGIYKQFEIKLTFKSLRKVIEEEMNLFLENENLDWSKNPEAHFVSTDGLRTLINPYGEVRIGNSIFILVEDGEYEITDADYNTVLAFRKGSDISQFPNVKFDNGEGEAKSVCRTNKRTPGFAQYNNRRITAFVRHRSVWGFRRVLAETTHYRRVNNKWRKRKAYLGVSLNGQLCYGSPVYELENPRKMRKSIKVKTSFVYENATKNQIYSGHTASCNGCSIPQLFLTW